MIKLFDLGDEEFEQEKFRRRQRIEVAGVASYLPSPEDVILQKVRWYSASPENRSDDRKDARNVMAVQGAGNLDWEYLRKWGGRHGTLGLLEEIGESVAGI